MAPGPAVGVTGLGIDAVDIDRFRHVVGRRPALIGRLFTEAERADASRRPDPVPSLAARFAAKEATWKALGVGLGGVGWRDVAVTTAPSGAPVLELTGRAARLARAAGCDRWWLSLTHTATVAIAAVVGEAAPTAAAARGGDPLGGGACSPS